MSTATAKQISFYNSLIAKCAETGAFDQTVLSTALAEFPARTVSDASAAIERAKRNLKVAEVKQANAMQAPASDALLQTGTYTVETETGHRTFKVITQKADADFAPGETIIQFLSGSDNESDYTGFAFVKPGLRLQVWKRFASSTSLLAAAAVLTANPEAALKSATCRRCNRKLTVPVSVHNGLGPECAKKG